ncbi:MAG: signal peptidase I [Sedimentisphaerales bacterium]|nr:signal peptidase I [Sedimentisphaerales bacterium]
MAKSDEAKTRITADKVTDRFTEIANTFEWIITALALAFVFRAFVMEAFRIPTGSMADTLLGAHYRLRCTECGYKYNYGQSAFQPSKTHRRSGFTQREYSRCPSCGYLQSIDESPLSNGDRILVLKCIYQFEEPKQWDVIVFKNPLDPTENYIKRLVGRPGETVEIIDGDVYINGKISRKPAKVQKELWRPVYDNDYQPARPEELMFNGHPWRHPWNKKDSSWSIDEQSPTIFRLDCPPEERNSMEYDTTAGNDFRATYAYDEIHDYRFMPYCSDLMVRFWVDANQPEGEVGVTLSKYGISYEGRVDFNGQMSIKRVGNANEPALTTRTITKTTTDKPIRFRFANVDHKLVLEFGEEKPLIYDLGLEPNDAGVRKTDIEPEAKIFGSGKIAISHLAIFRDIHYTAHNPNTNDPGRASEGKSLKLDTDQFFMLGDNSPRSEDSRWWRKPGMGNDGKTYPEGIVPREYLVGKALLVYWPAGFRPFNRFPLAVIPNVGQLRFIYGGSDYAD